MLCSNSQKCGHALSSPQSFNLLTHLTSLLLPRDPTMSNASAEVEILELRCSGFFPTPLLVKRRLERAHSAGSAASPVIMQ